MKTLFAVCLSLMCSASSARASSECIQFLSQDADSSNVTSISIAWKLSDVVGYIEAEYLKKFPNTQEISILEKVDIIIIAYNNYNKDWEESVPRTELGDWTRAMFGTRSISLATIMYLLDQAFPYTDKDEKDDYFDQAMENTQDWLRTLPLAPPEED